MSFHMCEIHMDIVSHISHIVTVESSRVYDKGSVIGVTVVPIGVVLTDSKVIVLSEYGRYFDTFILVRHT